MAATASALAETLNPGQKAHLYIFMYPTAARAMAENLNPGNKAHLYTFYLKICRCNCGNAKSR